MRRMNAKTRIAAMGALALPLLTCAGCSSIKGIFAADTSKDAPKPISNPFADYVPHPENANPGDSMIFRSKRPDGSLEVEIPKANQGVTDFVLPASGQGSRSPASQTEPKIDNSYADHPSTATDREITRKLSQGTVEDQQSRNDIEHGLGLVQAEDPTPERQKSYLASVDHVKQLYRAGRYEAGLIEVDGMIRDYPTDPKLYQMKGTLLQRLGRSDLAMQSWNQALRFDPSNESLRRFVEKRTRQPASTPLTSETPQ